MVRKGVCSKKIVLDGMVRMEELEEKIDGCGRGEGEVRREEIEKRIKEGCKRERKNERKEGYGCGIRRWSRRMWIVEIGERRKKGRMRRIG